MNFFKLKPRKSSSPSNPPELLTPTPPHLQRCPHVSRNGRRCRYRASSIAEPYCKYHRPPNSSAVLGKQLEIMAQNFDTPEGVNNVLYTIFFWLALGYISERKAGVLTYVAQTILNSQRTNLQLQKLINKFNRNGLCIDDPYEFAQLRKDQEAAAKSSSAPEPPSSNSPAVPSTNAVIAPSPQFFPASPSTSKQIATPDSNPASAPAVFSSAEPETSAVPQSVSTPAQPPNDSSSSTSSASFTSSTSSTSSSSSTPPPAKTSPPPKTPASPPIDLNHFYPRDPTLPVHIQDPRNFFAPPPLNRPRYKTVRRPNPADDDWKIINGR